MSHYNRSELVRLGLDYEVPDDAAFEQFMTDQQFKVLMLSGLNAISQVGVGEASSVVIHDGTDSTKKVAVASDGSLKVTGTFWQTTQPVSFTMPALVAGEAHIGEVGGNSAVITPTVTVTTSAYTSGDVVGGKITLTSAMRKSNGSAVLHSLLVQDAANQKPALDIFLFSQDPSAGTYTDNGAIAWNATDRANMIGVVSVGASDYKTTGGIAIADLSALARVVASTGSQASLFAVIVTTSTPTFATSTDLRLSFGFLRD